MSEETITYQVDVPLASGTVTVEVEYFVRSPRPCSAELFLDAIDTLQAELESAKHEFFKTVHGWHG
jgi:hypothetical protein